MLRTYSRGERGAASVECFLAKGEQHKLKMCHAITINYILHLSMTFLFIFCTYFSSIFYFHATDSFTRKCRPIYLYVYLFIYLLIYLFICLYIYLLTS